ncbi:MAG: phosphoadenosine phosphosulfate reductase family protein, partial [Pseudomonadota bacterium]
MPYSAIAISKPETVEERLVRMNEELRGASAQTILRASILREWQDEITYVSSFGAESAVMLALIADVDPDLPIVFLETGMHFPQTLDYKDELIERLGLGNVREIKPDEIERERVDQKNTLWKTDPDACCELRKVRPLEPALEGFGAWVTGRKRFHGGARLSLP